MHQLEEESGKSPYFVGQFDRSLVGVVCITLILSLADGFFTLQLITAGAKELNPVMDFYLGLGPRLFIACKYFLTSVSMLLLIVYQARSVFGGAVKGRHFLYVAPVVYATVVIYQLILLL